MSEETTAHNLHLTLSDAMEILGAVKHLKHLLTRAQDFENAAVMRDMEKEYVHLTVKRK